MVCCVFRYYVMFDSESRDKLLEAYANEVCYTLYIFQY